MKRRALTRALISALILASTFVSSCFFYKGYPKNWAPLKTDAKLDCWQILGTYSDEGLTSGKKPQPVSLSRILLSGGMNAWNSDYTPEGISVKIAKLSEDSLEISTWKDGKQWTVRTFSRSRKEFSCSSKGVTIPQGRNGYSGEGFAIGSIWMHLNLAINKEGSLVVEGVTSELGAFIVIPYAGGSSNWAIFKRIDASSP
jgi:hypothetical protein